MYDEDYVVLGFDPGLGVGEVSGGTRDHGFKGRDFEDLQVLDEGLECFYIRFPRGGVEDCAAFRDGEKRGCVGDCVPCCWEK